MTIPEKIELSTEKWWALPDSNRHSRNYEFPALTIKLRAHKTLKMVVVVGLEPTLGTYQVRHVYKTCGATLHYTTI